MATSTATDPRLHVGSYIRDIKHLYQVIDVETFGSIKPQTKVWIENVATGYLQQLTDVDVLDRFVLVRTGALAGTPESRP